MPEFSVEDLSPVLRSLDEAGWDAILVGRQAVNLWASRYEQADAAWQALRPYQSRDLDYHGGLAEARRAMNVLNARGRLNTGMEPSPNAGVLTVRLPGGEELLIDILTGLFGVSTAEVERTAVRFAASGTLEGLTMRVIHPLLLLEGKAASLRGLSQEGRQDAKHLRILCLVLKEWLAEQVSRPRDVFRAVERIGACTGSPDGLHAFAQGIDIWNAPPWSVMQSRPEYGEFFLKRWPQLTERIRTKRARHLEFLRDWQEP